jgi:hypothetical protein
MSVMSELRQKVKKMAADVASNKDLDADGKKKIGSWLDKIDDKLSDLGPRRDLLEKQISGLESLDDEIKDYNRDQGPLKDNGLGLSNTIKDALKKNPKAGDFLKTVGKTGDVLQALPDIKKN